MPEGSVPMPEGCIPMPEGSVLMPEGSVPMPEGSVPMPEGSATTSGLFADASNVEFRFVPGYDRITEIVVASTTRSLQRRRQNDRDR